MDPIPYIEHSFLSIDRKIFVKYRTLPFFFFRNSSYQRQLPTSTPPHTTSWGGAVRLLNQSSRGFIATFILKETEEPLVNRSPTSFSRKPIN